MNILLTLGLLLIIGYTTGWFLNKIGLPKIIGYIVTGIVFSPNSFNFVDFKTIQTTAPLMEVCLAFITFEVGGALKWSKIRRHEKEIVSITLMASFIPFILIASTIYMFGLLFPSVLSLTPLSLLFLSLLLGALSSPTAPAATLAVIHQYKSRGKVTDTILGVAALDDVLGIMLFSLTIAIIFIFTGGEVGLFGNPFINSFYEVGAAVIVGIVIGRIIDPVTQFFKIKGESQWVVIVFSLIVLCLGISKALHVDVLLSVMTMGMVTVNKCKKQKVIFGILERYSEDLIFLFFFLLSGLHLDVSTIPEAVTLIILFVVFRILGKFLGVYTGARMVNANRSIQKYTAGGLLPQAGIVIGLVLNVYQLELFKEISGVLLTTILGATVIHELIGPIAAKYTLKKSGEIKDLKKNNNK